MQKKTKKQENVTRNHLIYKPQKSETWRIERFLPWTRLFTF